MHRLFVAVRPPRPIRAHLLAAMGGIPGARWQDDEQLHITLRFIGEVDRHCAEDVAVALQNVHQPRFTIAIEGGGVFDRKGRVDALWAGVTPTASLRSLHNKIDQAMIRIGLTPEARSYLPHITLARFGRVGSAEVDIGGFPTILSTEPFEVTEFGLYESQLGSEGAVYTLAERYRLD